MLKLNNGRAELWQWGSSAHMSITTTGGDAAHNNMPPYLSVYVWAGQRKGGMCA